MFYFLIGYIIPTSLLNDGFMMMVCTGYTLLYCMPLCDCFGKFHIGTGSYL